MKANQVFRTVLYRSLAKKLPHKKEEILKELKRLVDWKNEFGDGVLWGEREVISAFAWNTTVQGFHYWRAIDEEFQGE